MFIPHEHAMTSGTRTWRPAGVVPVEQAPAPGPEDPRWAQEVVTGLPTRPHLAIVCACGETRLIPLDKSMVVDPRLDRVPEPL
jgi:hypothetical protein